MSKLAIEVVHSKSLKSLFTIDKLSASNTIKDVKNQIESLNAKYYPDRQMLRSEATGKPLKDEIKLSDLTLRDGTSLKLYFKDLGPQVGWTTVFMTEYAGPLFIYLIFYSRPWFIYGASAKSAKYLDVVNYACVAWTFHYAKRLFETRFVHRFSHGTMPLRNIFKNSFYYWGFAAYVAYYINHPLYTRASYGDLQIYIGLAGFLFNEIGNLSIHVALRNLRPPGTKERRIPNATSNPFTLLFNLVSCPNYTYEIGSWIFFSIMTQSVPAALFTIAGAYQMVIWALGKHRNYRKEFDKYPRGRKSIIPFVI